jgi:bifunctional DNA-binding transcriptional regulator/antitoxin component of YhaV-PrlF toxin-antitoxin module
METILIRSKGNVTLPMALRKKYKINEGDPMTLIDLGEGAFMLMPGISRISVAGKEIQKIMEKRGAYGDDLIKDLDDEREQYYQKQYGKT